MRRHKLLNRTGYCQFFLQQASESYGKVLVQTFEREGWKADLAVSYTHLDVYKRQVFFLIVLRIIPCQNIRKRRFTQTETTFIA